ncbi:MULTISPECIES: restriction endonuclease [unclassified Streptomyces]|uniref:restriction endonuclease n=1 Tax=unclassified Streptomyces TaxID=2593676 RepID=UPI001BE56702|nr:MULTISPECIES: restriction endonuclease [unclassified Streptomyces]MBT2404565.1 restriction endonuclease [Streptomyces sp. ISL-21]MBT2612132.1 restriction endonuclease [Streptomyces sp. ISL-87]
MLVAAVLAAVLFPQARQGLERHGSSIATIAVAALAAGALVLLLVKAGRRGSSAWAARRRRPEGWGISFLDGLHHTEFEEAVRDLMRRDGAHDAVRVGGAGDNGADVKGTDPAGRRWVIQCKHRRDGAAGAAVGTPDLHVLNGTGRPVHGGDVVVLVTNGRITGPAKEFARSQRLHLVDRRLLDEWSTGSTPLWDLLSQLPAPRRHRPGIRWGQQVLADDVPYGEGRTT